MEQERGPPPRLPPSAGTPRPSPRPTPTHPGSTSFGVDCSERLASLGRTSYAHSHGPTDTPRQARHSHPLCLWPLSVRPLSYGHRHAARHWRCSSRIAISRRTSYAHRHAATDSVAAAGAAAERGGLCRTASATQPPRILAVGTAFVSSRSSLNDFMWTTASTRSCALTSQHGQARAITTT